MPELRAGRSMSPIPVMQVEQVAPKTHDATQAEAAAGTDHGVPKANQVHEQTGVKAPYFEPGEVAALIWVIRCTPSERTADSGHYSSFRMAVVSG